MEEKECDTASGRRGGTPRVVVCQLGSREYYQIPVMAHCDGVLARLVTDFWFPWANRAPIRLVGGLGISAIERARSRFHPAIPSSKVRVIWNSGVQAIFRRPISGDRGNCYRRFIETDRQFSEACIRHLQIDHSVFFGFASASLEAIRYEKRRGVRIILDQFDPAREEDRIVAEEARTHQRFATTFSPIPEEVFDRLLQEWELSSAIVVNSNWTRECLLRQGVSEEKISVVPLMYVGTRTPRVIERLRLPLKILWLGTLNLRKGFAYALQAAERMLNDPVLFTFVGPSEIPLGCIQWPPNCSYIGAVAPNQVEQIFHNHDLFLFPTLSDGFGITQLQAMAAGLPVITTRCCGDVVVHLKNGILIKPRSTDQIIEALRMCVDDLDMVVKMSHAAYARSLDFLSSVVWPRLKTVMFGSSKSCLSV